MYTRRKSRTCITLIKNRRGRLIMAGDRRVSGDWSSSFIMPIPKIAKKNNGMLIGASGSGALCKLVVDIFEPPEIKTKNIDTYINYQFLPALYKQLRNQPGFRNDKNMLILDSNEICIALLGVKGKAYEIIISGIGNNEDNFSLGRIEFDNVPLPHAIGCGASTALPILYDENKKLRYNTKETLLRAMEIAAEISPGCDNNIDIIAE